MKFKIKYLTNTATGMFLGAVIALSLAWILDTEAATELKRFYVFIFSAILSLLAAGLALTGVLTGLDQQRRLDQEARERKIDSARAFLPNALSKFGDLARRGLHHNYQITRSGAISGVIKP